MVDTAPRSIDFSPLGELYNTYRKGRAEADISRAREQIRANPGMGQDEMSRLLIGAGDLQGGATLAGIYNQVQQRALQERTLAETIRQHDQTAGHQTATLEEQKRAHKVTELTPQKIGTDLSGDIYGVRAPTVPGGFLRVDVDSLPLAGQPAPVTGPRPGGPVPSTPKVVGDDEAVKRGLYPPPAVASVAAPAAPAMTREQKAGLTGEEFLKTIPPNIQPLIKGVAEYEIAPTTFSNRGQREKILAAVKQYKPDFDETDYGNRFLTKKRFTSGTQGDTLRSMNVGIDHLHTLQEYADALHNGNVQLINAAKAKFQKQFGYDAPTSFNAVKAIVGSEVSKAIIGSRGALEDRKEIKEGLTTSSAPDQLSGIIKAYKALMAGQVRGLKQQYDSSGLKDFHKKLTPATMRELGLNEDGSAAATEAPKGAGLVSWETYFGKK